MSKKLNTLNIWLNGEYVGLWQIKAGREELKYDDSWIDNKQGRALSLSLPFTPGNQVYKGDVVRFYFDNLLPDSKEIRERLAIKFSARSLSAFDLLVELGRDCVGAIQLLPEHEEPKDIKSINYKTLNEADVANIVRNTMSYNVVGHSNNANELRLSLAGAQEKTALLWHENQWCMPYGSTPTTHIFKLPLGLVGNMKADMSQSVENEWLCLKILSAYGIPVAHCEMKTFEDQKILIVERFDRRISSNGNWIIRLPQEDMCQAKGVSSLMKYQRDGGLGISECMRILEGSDKYIDTRVFFMSQVIFWMLYATDGHSKNFSIRHKTRNSYNLAPLYDVLSVLPIIGGKNNQIPRQKAKLAMAIRGSSNHYLIDKIQYAHFIKQAKQVGITEVEADALIQSFVDETPNVISAVEAMLPSSFPLEVADTIFKGLLNQSNKLKK